MTTSERFQFRNTEPGFHSRVFLRAGPEVLSQPVENMRQLCEFANPPWSHQTEPRTIAENEIDQTGCDSLIHDY